MIQFKTADGEIADQIKVKLASGGIINIACDSIESYSFSEKAIFTKSETAYHLSPESATAFERALEEANQLCILVGDDGDRIAIERLAKHLESIDGGDWENLPENERDAYMVLAKQYANAYFGI